MPAAAETLPVAGEEKEAPPQAQTAKPIVGIIYPPPEVRNIVDKTASFVARNGPEFEARIRQNELNNPKFNFLNPGDPYHAYYQHKVKEFKEGKAQDTISLSIQQSKLPTAQQRQQDFLKQVEQPFVLKDPPLEFEFIADPPSISAFDLDVVKLTAQFVARNGRQFLTNLMTREQRNYQFDFLRPQHSLFQYFTKLLEQYTKVLIPPKDLMRKLKEESQNMNIALDQVKYRAEWIKHEEIQKRKEEEEAEKERVAYAQIDWHDFVVVETVDYQSYEQGHFPPPTTPDEVGARVLLQERLEEGDEVEMQIESDEEVDFAQETKDDTQVQDMEEESSEEEDDRPDQSQQSGQGRDESTETTSPSKDANQPSLMMPLADKVIIKKGYDPKAATRTQRGPAPDEYLISLITGEKIPASKVEEHMRIGLLDPRWVEQRDRQMQEKLNQESVYAPGSAIEASLKRLAERRTDIFGVGDEETAIGKKIGEEDKRKEEKVTWDGHTSSVEAATRAARANITLEDQIHQIHKVKGLLPDEEKEKIGPKPNPSRSGGNMLTTSSVSTSTTTHHHHQQTMKATTSTSGMSKAMGSQGVTIKAAPVPQAIPPKPTISAPPVPAPPVGPPTMTTLGGPGMHPMAGMPPGGLMAPQPGMMMVPPMPTHLRPPPMMAFPVAAPSAPPVGNFMPGPPNPGQMPPPQQAPVMVSHLGEALDDEPPSKKQRTEENLMPEGEFLSKHHSPVTFKVSVPQGSEKPDWKLNGQMITLTLPLTDSVSVIKAKIHEETGMPPGKQKLQWEGLFFKDSNSLAYYNISHGGMVQLQVKERGGRKK